MGGIGSLLGGGGKNSFKAKQAKLSESDYGDAIKNAMAQTTGQMDANANAATNQNYNSLISQLQGQVAGTGPSLAQQQLQNATQQTQAQAAGSLASAKGINPALAARMIAQQQTAAAQTAAGQSATTRLQEQLSSEQQLANTIAQQQAGNQSQQSVNTSTLGTLGGLQNQQNANRVGNVSQANQTNAQVAAQNAQTGGNMLGGLLGAAGAIGGSMIAPGIGTAIGAQLGSAVGGAVTKFDGGEIEDAPVNLDQIDPLGDAFALALIKARLQNTPAFAGLAHGGPVDFTAGGPVPGRAQVQGDSPRNDTVHAMVSPGEIVIPRTVAQSPDAPDQAAEFVKAIKAKSKAKGPVGYGRVLATQRALEARLARLETMAEGGEVKGGDDSMVDRIVKWWHARPGDDSADAGKEVADKVAASTPVVAGTRQKIRGHNARLEAAYAAATGN